MKRTHLGEVAERIDYGVTASAKLEPIGPKFLRITDIQDGTVDWTKVPYCQAEQRKLKTSALRIGDIVFARTGATTGKSFLIKNCPEHAVFASYLIRVRPGKQIDPSFLAQFFQSPDYWQQISLKAAGAAQPGVNASKLEELTIPLPVMSEQRRIAAILDQADALRAKRRAVLTQLDEMVRAIFVEMFGDVVANSAKWPDQDTLGNHADIASGITKGRKLPSDAVRDVPYLAVANVQDRRLSLSNVKTIEASEKEIARYRLQLNDLLLTEGGDPDKLGRGSLWKAELTECIHQNHVFRVRMQSSLNPIFLNWLIGSQRGKEYFFKSAKQTTGIASINMNQLRSFPLLLPPLDLQDKFGDRVTQLDALKVLARVAISNTDALFASLQHRAFAGEL